MSNAVISMPNPRLDRRITTDDARIARFRRDMGHLLLDEAKLRAWSRVLVVECGDGWVAEEAWRRLGRGYVCGADLSDNLMTEAQRVRGVDGELEFRTWDGVTLPFGDGAFDCVLATSALYRHEDPGAVLREALRVLRGDGDIFLLEPDRKSFWGVYKLWDYYFRLTDPNHVRYYSSSELIQLLGQAGFQGVRELRRHEKVISGGKLLATAVVIHARREA